MEEPGGVPPLSEAKQTLLRALEEIERCETDVGAGARVGYLCVVYSVSGRLNDDEEIAESGGWVATSEPSWITSAMLRRAADAIESATRPADDSEDDD